MAEPQAPAAAPPPRRRVYRARVERIRDHNADTRSLFLRLVDGERFAFVPGQFISISLVLEGETRVRPYTVASSPEEADAIEICAAARAAGVAAYLDGARLFNASVASGIPLAELARPFDLVSVALSKGLGCPVGSVLAGSAAEITRAVRARRMFGGAMRQSGILAAAGLYALDHHVARLAEDHANARLIAERLASLPGIVLDLATVETNIIVFRLAPGLPDAAALAARAKEAEVLVSALGPRTVRAVTHRDVSRDSCRRAAELLAEIIKPG